MFRYRLSLPDGSYLGEAAYAMQIQPGEIIHFGGATRYLVLAVVPFKDVPDSPFTGMLEVEPAA